jgi:hypothetical protein
VLAVLDSEALAALAFPGERSQNISIEVDGKG